jgi:hypothetical protein
MSGFGSIKSHGEASSNHSAVGPINTGPSPLQRIEEAYRQIRKEQEAKPTAKAKPAPKPKAKPVKPPRAKAQRDAAERIKEVKDILKV